jgi:serine/threonine protein kinase
MKKVGDYILLSELGKGQFGIVYKAKNQLTNDLYAVKTVKKSSITSSTKLKNLFDTEIQVMSKLKHPNILHLHEYLETGNNYYLVIDYCNSGDLENHLKKHQFLGEEESVYFLMQIMNGFKELHKNQIMHRDFKLANIFLHDDKLIIGDFGFAKSGFDMATTKLGSPITMAPELLLNKGGKLVYTNKADLWSIGVCFYQMIFGVLPWDVKDIEELQHKVQVQSGKNLPIHNEKCKISAECHDLLIRLLEPNPKQRIEWNDFFNHKLFLLQKEKQSKKEAALNMRQSIMFRNNQDDVLKMFDKNRAENLKEIELQVEPENLVMPQSKDSQNPMDKNVAMALKLRAKILSRYTHEKKTIVFFMYTCRKLRNLAKERTTLKKAANGLMYVAILLLKKGIIMNNVALRSLKKGTNEYGLEGFAEFVKSDDKERLLEELETKDSVLYNKLFQHLKDKVREEVGPTDQQRTQDVLKLVEDGNENVKSVEDELRKETYFLVQYFSKSLNTFTNTLKYEMMMALAHLYTSANHADYLQYEAEGVPFDWNEFDKSWSNDQGIDKINKVLNKALNSK